MPEALPESISSLRGVLDAMPANELARVVGRTYLNVNLPI